MVDQSIPSSDFYSRNPAVVAKELVGKRLVRRIDGAVLEGRIVETEAYLGLEDPASRAFKGMKEYNQLMWREPGKIFIYNVHKYWMFNIVSHDLGDIGAVLIRALEPMRGIEVMLRNRQVRDVRELTNGPGKLAMALSIDKKVHGLDVTSKKSEIFVVDDDLDVEIGKSKRIGVKKDLEEDLRFYIKRNIFVSK